MKTEKRSVTNFLSPPRLFLVLLSVICGFEWVIMVVLHRLAPEEAWMTETLIDLVDPFLLTLFSAPFFWLLVISPLRDALFAQKSKVETVLEHVVEAIVMYDRNGIIESFNPAATAIFGWTAAEAVGKNVAMLVPSEADASTFTTVETSRQATNSVRGIRKDMSGFPMDMSVSEVAVSGQPMYVAIMRDMSEQKRHQAVLAEEKDFSQSLIRNSAVPTFVVDRSHRVVIWNRACEELTGVKEAEIVGSVEGWRVFYSCRRPLLADLVIEGNTDCPPSSLTIRRSAFIMEGLEAEGWYPGLNGQDRYICSNAAPIRNGQGDLIAVIETLQDMTERKQASLKLEESENRLKIIVDTAVDGIITISESGTIESANRACRRIFGYGSDELVGRDISMLMPSPFREEHADYLARYLETGEKRMLDSRSETVALHRNGNTFPVELAVSEVYLGERRLFTGIVTEIVERKKREEEMARALSLLNATLEATADGIMVTDTSGKIVAYNRQFVEMWQIPETVLHAGAEDEALQLALQQLKHPAEYAAHVRRQYNRPDAETSYIFEFQDGRVFERHSKPQRIGDTIVGRVRSYHDLTEQKTLEYQLRHSQKMEAMGTLAGGIAHDFNNILTAIIGYGTLLQMRVEEASPLAHPVEQILLAAGRATTLTQSLLAYSRKQTMHMAVVDLNFAVRNMHDFLSRLLGEGIELTTSLTEDHLAIIADSGQLEQIMMNLATNARDAMREGGILAIRTSVEDLDEDFIRSHGYGNEGRYACLSVSDNGEGIDKETRERIFEPFFSTKEVGKGTGLGLSIVYGIVKQHNGFINVYSEKGFGTTFRIYIPVTHDALPEREEKPAIGNSGGNETILLVEDNEDIRILMEEVLGNAGYRVLLAEDGEAGLARFSENQSEVQLVILDVIMPKKNGKEVYEEIRRVRSDVKALFTSGYTADIINKQGLSDSALNFVSKPLSPNKLLAKVREVLDGCKPSRHHQ